MLGNSTTQDQQENQEKDGRKLSRGLHYRSLRLEEMRWGQRRMETPFEGGQCQEGVAAPYMDGG
jgi:hypothetical protein